MALWVIASGVDDRRAGYAREQSVAVVGWARSGDLTGVESRDAVRERLALGYPTSAPEAIESWAQQLWWFVDGMAQGDMVAMPLKQRAEVMFGRVVGPYRYDEQAPDNRQHQRPVRWLRTVPVDTLDAGLRAALDTELTVHPVRTSMPESAPLPQAGERRIGRRAFVAASAAAALGAGAAAAAIFRPWRRFTDRPAAHGHGGNATAGSVKAPSSPSRTGPSPNGPVAEWVLQENAKPGTQAWNVIDPGRDGAIEGFASAVSAQRGDTVTLYVSTTAPTFHIEAYRMGYYQGNGGRLIWQSPETPGKAQPPAVVTPGTNMAEGRWEPSLKMPIDETFPPGVYLLKIMGSNRISHLIPLTIRDDASTAAYVVQNSVTSWQAYNDWGGYSLYYGPRQSFTRRARVVSFDRPYAGAAGSADFLGLEHPLIMLMEQLGLDVTYITDVDTHQRPELLVYHKAFVSLGHDEYWSKEMRDGVEGARDHGVNLAFLGANAAFRQIRFESSGVGPNRRQVCYKSASEDPMRKQNPALTTVNWREAPVSRPESTMIGQQYECNPVRADMVIVDPTAWVFTGTGLNAGQHLDTTVGAEYDRYDPSQQGPKNVQILAHSPVTCGGKKSFSDMTYYSTPSGAGVFATGTIFWISKLMPAGPGSPNNPLVVQITKNVLAAFGEGPAGEKYPSTANFDAVVRQFGKPRGGVSGTD